ncbi:MAG TPA: nucleoside triphosphate pyrophosphohydrolase family protein [Methanosarcina sp.]|nr:nucleoside triphosphate pyrophosphohydrolase family protein [Methanosarcina sp.]
MIELINLWFKRAVPNPTPKNQAVQLGCHYEEVAEMATALQDHALADQLTQWATSYKKHGASMLDPLEDKQELLDALCDQIVTAVGLAHMYGLNIVGALEEVNRSNWSKFVDGNPLFDENGKIKKGPSYSPPDLSKFV